MFCPITKKYDDPFLTPDTEFSPRNLTEALEFCRVLYRKNPLYAQASKRVISHFIEDVVFDGKGDADERKNTRDYLRHTLKIFSHMATLGKDWACYGNGFYRLARPYDRYLRIVGDTEGDFYYVGRFNIGELRYNWKEKQYVGPNPKTNGKTEATFTFEDVPSTDRARFQLVRLDPRDMRIMYSTASGRRRYIWRFPETLKTDIKRNVIFQVNETPKDMLYAIAEDKDFLFDDGAIFHFGEEGASGDSESGWYYPPLLANFASLYQLQVYRKADQVIALDHLHPMRYFSLEPQALGGTNNTSIGIAAEVAPMLDAAIRQKRKEPDSIFAFPAPIRYEEAGGNGKNYSPKELVEYQTNDVLDGVGYPSELFRFSLQMQAAPTAFRIMERVFDFAADGLNEFLRWSYGAIQRYLGEEVLPISLKRPSIAQDLDKQNILLQLGFEGQIPKSMWMPNLGIQDPVAARKEAVAEEIEMQMAEVEAQEQAQRAMEAKQSMGIGLDMGMEGQQGPMTPQSMEEKAYALAREWGAIPSDGERSKAMQEVHAQDIQLYALAKEFLEQIRSQGASEGRQQANMQMQEGSM